ncbi:MAG: SsrA-binding protein SmpB, partial [Tissierellia bacterium]|nr:SsrA-binding protein SmpB [Tissierellia bacterium]
MAKNKKPDGNLVTNRKARHEYFIEDVYEAGLVLKGTEVKSIRQGSANIQDAYISFKNQEAFIENMHISPYEQGNIFNEDPIRRRKLLLHKKEIKKLHDEVQRQGVTVVPLRLYLSKGNVKMEIAVAKGKKLYDKRDSIAERDSKRRVDRALRESVK